MQLFLEFLTKALLPLSIIILVTTTLTFISLFFVDKRRIKPNAPLTKLSSSKPTVSSNDSNGSKESMNIIGNSNHDNNIDNSVNEYNTPKNRISRRRDWDGITMTNKVFFDDKAELVNHILSKIDINSSIRVQKVLYLLYAYYGAIYGSLEQEKSYEEFETYPKGLFNANFEAWQYGPIDSEVWSAYKKISMKLKSMTPKLHKKKI